MEVSETISLLQKKIFKILSFLILIRLGLYIPVPNVDLDIFSQNQATNPLFNLAKIYSELGKFRVSEDY